MPLQFLEVLRFGGRPPGELRFSVVVGRFGDPVLAAQLCRLQVSLDSVQDADDFFFSEPRPREWRGNP